MKVCLLFPRFKHRIVDLPLGVGYLSSVLIHNGFSDTILLDGTFQSEYECLTTVRDKRPDVLGISVQTMYADRAFSFAKKVKGSCPNTMIVFGGPHATILPLETIRNPFVDVVCVGEGEYTFLELIKGVDLRAINGIVFRDDGHIVSNPPRSPIKDLDEIPFPAYHLYHPYYFKRAIGMMASRGCPFNCSFCQPALRKIFPGMRFRSPENVIEEMTILRDRYHVKLIQFHDDTFTVNKAWVTKLCEAMMKENLGIKWIANSRADTVSPSLLKLMRNAGCIQLNIGVESGDPFIRNVVLGKNISDEHIINCFKWTKEVGIKRYAFLMVGTPGESMLSIVKTLKLLDLIKPDGGTVTVTTPLPGTKLFKFCEEQRILTAKRYEEIDYTQGYSVIRRKNFTPNEIKRVRVSIFFSMIANRLFSISHEAFFKIVYPLPNIVSDIVDLLKDRVRRLHIVRMLIGA